VVVDDNSDPEKVDFSAFPGLADPYVEVCFTKAGGGAGYARNIGLERARGEWILFADADDFFTGELLTLIGRHKGSDSDIIYFTTRSVYSDDINRPAGRDYNNARILGYLHDPGPDALRRLRYGIPEPWGKIVRTSLIRDNHIRFEESVVDDDYRFSLEIGHAARKIAADKSPLYVVTHRQGSLSTQEPTFEIVKTRMLIFGRAHSFFRENNIPHARHHFSYTMMWLLRARPVWFFRICGALVKEDPNNIFNILDSLRIIPRMVKDKLNSKKSTSRSVQ